MKNEKIIQAAQIIKEVLGSQSCGIEFNPFGKIHLFIHGQTNDSATEIFRRLGIQKRRKNTFPSGDNGWHTLEGETEDGIILTTYCSGLPPTCHLEKYVEKIPKQQTVDTGEFIEVERVKVVCTEKDDV